MTIETDQRLNELRIKEEKTANCLTLRPELTFDNYIVTVGNAFECSWCKKAISLIGRQDNVKFTGSLSFLRDMFITGGRYVGKTHLLRAIQNKLIQDGYKAFYADGDAYQVGLMTPVYKDENGYNYRKSARYFLKKHPADCYIFDDFNLNLIFPPQQKLFLQIRKLTGNKPFFIAARKDLVGICRRDNSICPEMMKYLGFVRGTRARHVIQLDMFDEIETLNYSFGKFRFSLNDSDTYVSLTEDVFQQLKTYPIPTRYKILINMWKTGKKRITKNNAKKCWPEQQNKQS